MPAKDSVEAASRDRPVDKGTLFCVACPYHSGYNDGWTTVETDDSVHYLCPNCGTEIATRSTGGTRTVRAAPVIATATEGR